MQKDHLKILGRILNSYAPVGQAATELLMENGNIEELGKDETLIHEKKFNAFEYFQLEGISHRFNVDSDMQTITTGIYQHETVITPHFTRTNNSQSIFSLQTLTNCCFLKVPAGIFRDISDQDQQIRIFGRAVVEKEFIRSINFEVLFRTYNAKDRLLYFRNNYPLLENIIPHTVIASFLGITPVSLSRLRTDLAKK